MSVPASWTMLHTNLIMYFEEAWLEKKQDILLVDLQRTCGDVEIKICIYNVYKV